MQNLETVIENKIEGNLHIKGDFFIGNIKVEKQDISIYLEDGTVLISGEYVELKSLSFQSFHNTEIYIFPVMKRGKLAYKLSYEGNAFYMQNQTFTKFENLKTFLIEMIEYLISNGFIRTPEAAK